MSLAAAPLNIVTPLTLEGSVVRLVPIRHDHAELFFEAAKDDLENMRIQFPAYDALYKYCQLRLQGKAKVRHPTR